MKADRLQDSDLEKLSNAPVVIIPFNPESKQAAKVYGNKLDTMLAPFSVQAELFGSTDLEIDGKGEWEFGIWLDDQQWYSVLIMLINHFGSIYTLDDDFALFEDVYEGSKVEVIPMRGDASARNQAIMKYWRTNPEAATAYQRGKIEHAYSKREYYRWKNKHISDIVETL
jgi:GrpB-like predicted nucleotidyltransferase (UPF0157 family)